MKIGVVYPQTELKGDPIAVKEIGLATENLGYDHLLAYDHVVGATHDDREPELWGPYTNEDPFHCPFTMFSYLAGVTQNIELVTGVIILPQRQTALVAKQTTDVDLLSGERLRLGVGTGWNYVEYDALGQDFSQRGPRLSEQIELLRKYWSEDLFSFEGEYDRIDRGNINIRPNRQIPVWLGGFSEIAFKRAGKLGDGFIYAGDIDLARKFHQIKQEKKSDYLIAGEASFDLQMPYYEMSYFRIYKNHVPLHRYIATDSEMMIGVFGHNDRHLLNQALMYRYIISYEPRNYKGRLHEFPLPLEYGKQVDQLRRRYHNLLWHSEFRDTVGATVLADNESFDTYSVFLDPDSGRRAVVVANPHADRPLAVEVRLPDGSGPLVSATPEKPVSQPSDGHALLPALSTIVFMEPDR